MERQFRGVFYDGETSRPHDVAITLQSDCIEFAPADGAFRQRWAFADIVNIDEAVPGRSLNLGYAKMPDAKAKRQR